MNLGYRYENKYIVTDKQIGVLRYKLDKVLRLDPNVGNDKMYSIRSLYFDDYENSAYWDVVDGICERSKWRIRMYGTTSSILKLERKSRKNDLVRKEFTDISKAEVEAIFCNRLMNINSCEIKLKSAFYLDMNTKGLIPRVIVEYDRTPFIYDFQGIRITLDTNVSASSYCSSFFDCNMSKRPVMSGGMGILEVKYNDYLPQNIRDILFMHELYRSSFSKYTMSRDAMGIIS